MVIGKKSIDSVYSIKMKGRKKIAKKDRTIGGEKGEGRVSH